MAVFELGDDNMVAISNKEMVEGRETEYTCPECEEHKLVIQEQTVDGGRKELYLECSDEDCGMCFYDKQFVR